MTVFSLAACNGGGGGGGAGTPGATPDPIASVVVSEFNPNWAHTGVFEPATTCADCHQSNGVVMQHAGNDVSPSTQWQHSVMAHSFNDPYWQAAVEDEIATFPDLAGEIGNDCTTCHAPMAHKHAHQTLTNLDANGHFTFETAQSLDHAREGISCTLCHQINNDNIVDANPATGTYDDRSFTGNFSIDPAAQEIGGPYAGPSLNPMFNQSGYTPKLDTLTQKSELCATCHTLYTPVIDVTTGIPNGNQFLEQAPFLEWLNSDYATGNGAVAVQQCQDCHMPEPAPGYTSKISTRPAGAPNRSPFAQHTLLGGNAHLLEMLGAYRSELGISNTTSVQGFQDQADLTRAFLASSSAELAVNNASVAGGVLTADIEITNKTGHKLPSAYPSRRMWLHVTVTDENTSQVIFESGKPDSNGRISTDTARLQDVCMQLDKPVGFDSTACYESHRNTIDEPEEVAIYETVLGDTNNVITHTLLRAASYLKDNRIPPVGFTNAQADIIDVQTRPSGVSGDSDFNCVGTAEGCGKDTVEYEVDVSAYTGPFTVEARLLYQAVQPAFVDGLHSSGPLVNRFKAMYEAVPPSSELLATTSVSGVN